jgi:hypothetical protein
MFMKKGIFFLTMLFAMLTISKAQNLTGTWVGSSDSGKEYWRMVLMQIGDSCYGYTYDAGPGFCKADFIASYNLKENKFNGQATRFIESSLDHTILIATSLTYNEEADAEYLTGVVRPKSAASKIFTLTKGYKGRLKRISKEIDSTIFIMATARRLKKKSSSTSIENFGAGSYFGSPRPQQKEAPQVQRVLPPKKEIIIEKETAPQIKQISDTIATAKEDRLVNIVRTIITKADSVKIILYDDGEVDGDIITVFDNGNMVASKMLLTNEPWQLTVALPYSGSKHTIELLAENEGSIPPNTSYILVLAGEQREEVKISSGKLSSAAIVIQRY